eukprot:CAMPEP_0170230258 /NCGR_PEP_ID=MMETSP0116_2-20130129/14859_1 /TAXON_ID=400756 /ORGANISM="Durinskia baltica, Strain CSIRO CS-38" /LENGTH=409 /DNA_ID=CAMNT_0010481021 /DNA_START=84 /DNA_END=1313 /DNA_ORIENTATION=+
MFGFRVPSVLLALAIDAAFATRPFKSTVYQQVLEHSLAQSSGAAASSTGACRNDGDEAIMREVSRDGEGVPPEFKERMRKVAKSYALSPFKDDARYIMEFQSSVMEVSDSCAGCFLELFRCSSASCKSACMPALPWAKADVVAKKEQQCEACREGHCECAFTECAGSTFRTLHLSALPPPSCPSSLSQQSGEASAVAQAAVGPTEPSRSSSQNNQASIGTEAAAAPAPPSGCLSQSGEPPASADAAAAVHPAPRRSTDEEASLAQAAGLSRSSGACSNPADEAAARAAWGQPSNSVPISLKTALKKLATGYALSFGGKDAYVSKFQAQVMPVSDGCARCYLDNFSCTAANCKMVCMPPSPWAKDDAVAKKEEQCDECRITSCECEMMACAGSTFSTLGLSPQPVPTCEV